MYFRLSNQVLFFLFSLVAWPRVQASVAINWFSAANAILQTDGSSNAPSTWTAQLIWSPDAAVSPVNLFQPYTPTGGEVVLVSAPLNTLNATAGRITYGLFRSNNSFVGGSVYTRVFNTNYNNGNPALPTASGDSLISGPLVIETTDPLSILRHQPSIVLQDRTFGAPTILVYGNSQLVPKGSLIPSLVNHTDFGTAYKTAAPLERIFSVVNSGSSVRTLSSLVLPAGYTLVEGLSPTLAAGASDTFTVRVTTATEGTFAGSLSFTTDDPAASGSYFFSVTAFIRAQPALSAYYSPPSLPGWQRFTWSSSEPVTWSLVSSPVLGAAAVWTPVAGTPILSGSLFRLDLAPGAFNRSYFRLRTP